MARFDPTFLEEAACHSRVVALHVLESETGNSYCMVHNIKDKANHARNGWGRPGAKVKNIPGKRHVFPKVLPSGLMNCGCRVDDALFDFFFSKILSVGGWINGVWMIENMTGADYFHPRERGFIFSAMKWFAGNELSVDDLYKGDLPAKQYQQRISLLIIKRHAKVLNGLDLGFEWKLTKTPVVKPAEQGGTSSNPKSPEAAKNE